jgi:hypothetical protein
MDLRLPQALAVGSCGLRCSVSDARAAACAKVSSLGALGAASLTHDVTAKRPIGIERVGNARSCKDAGESIGSPAARWPGHPGQGLRATDSPEMKCTQCITGCSVVHKVHGLYFEQLRDFV